MQLMNISKWVNTTMDAMKWFVNATKEIFETQYLKQLTKINFETDIKINKVLSFPNVFISLNCMHYWWKICPIV